MRFDIGVMSTTRNATRKARIQWVFMLIWVCFSSSAMSAMSILLVSQLRLELQVVAIKMGMRSQYSEWSMIISDYKRSVGKQLWIEMFWISHSGASILGGSGNCRKPWDWCNPTFCRKPLKPWFFFSKKLGVRIFWMVSCRLSLLWDRSSVPFVPRLHLSRIDLWIYGSNHPFNIGVDFYCQISNKERRKKRGWKKKTGWAQ